MNRPSMLSIPIGEVAWDVVASLRRNGFPMQPCNHATSQLFKVQIEFRDRGRDV